MPLFRTLGWYARRHRTGLIISFTAAFALLQLATCHLPDYHGRALLEGIQDADIVGYLVQTDDFTAITDPKSVKELTLRLRECQGTLGMRQPTSDLAYSIEVVTRTQTRRMSFPTGNDGLERYFGRPAAELIATERQSNSRQDPANIKRLLATKAKVKEIYIP